MAWNTPITASPSDGTDNWTGVSLDWVSVANSENYEVQLDTTPAFNSGAFRSKVETYINSSSGNNDTDEYFNDLYFGKTYYWRVRAWVAGDTSSWSTAITFNTRDYVTLISPSDGAQTWTGNTFDWGSHAGVDFYEIQLDTSASFNSPVFQNDIEGYLNSSSGNNDTEEYFSDLFFGTTYYWRVRAINAVDTSEWTIVSSVNTRDYVTLVSPSDGAQTWTGNTFDWGSHAGVDFYEIQLDTSASFNSPVFQNDIEGYLNSSSGNSDTEEYFSDLYFGTTYYWRVRAINAVDTSEWTIVSSVNTRDYVTLTSPSDGAQTWTGNTFDWGSHAGVDFYEIQLDTSASFNSPVFQNDIEGYLNSSSGNSDTEEYFSDLYFGTTYYWRVRAINAVDTSEWTIVSSVNTRDYVTLTSPSDGAQTWTGNTFDWGSHTGVDFYEIQLDTSASFNSSVFQNDIEGYLNSSSGNSDTEEYFSDMYFGTTYYWRVRAINAVDTSEWTIVSSINTRDYVTLSSPSDGSDQWTGIGFDWSSHSGVDFYEIQIDSSAGFGSVAFQNDVEAYNNSSSGNPDTYECLSDMYFGETYYWRVRAINAVDTSEWTTRSYTTRDYVTLSSPSDGSDQWTGIGFDWSSHSGVDFYEIQIDSSAGFGSVAFQNDVEAYNNSSSGNPDTYEYLTDMYFGEMYYWRVRAINAVDTSEWTTRNYTTRDYVNLSSPSDLATNQSTSGVGLNWNSHSGVDFYEAEWDTTNLFNSAILGYQQETYLNTSSGNNDTYHSTGTLLGNQIYHWHVRAINAVDTSAWTSRIFSTGSSIVLPSTPNLISPADGSVNLVSSVSFDWDDAVNSEGYEIQYSTDGAFGTYSTVNTMSSNHGATGLVLDEVYYWRVRSVKGGSYSEWSDVWSFNTFTIPCSDSYQTINPSACNSYESPSGKLWTVSNTYADTIPNMTGCDSIITVNLTITTLFSFVDTVGSSAQGCNSIALFGGGNNGNMFEWLKDGSSYYSASLDSIAFFTEDGDYSVVVSNGMGCADTSTTISIDIIELNAAISAPGGTSSCGNVSMLSAGNLGLTFEWLREGISLSSMTLNDSTESAMLSGNYQVVVDNGVCSDTSTTLNVTIASSTSSSISPMVCGSYTSPSGKVWMASNVYSDTIMNTAGCDSIIAINLTVGTPTSSVINESRCGAYQSPSGKMFTSTGMYSDTIVNASGCDSVLSINLVINTFTSSQIDVEVCDEYISPSGKILNQTAIYSDTIPNASGCDSIISINLTITNVNVFVAGSDMSLIADATGVAYQWLNCTNSFLAFFGDTSRTFTASESGSYAVEITDNGCVDTSSCFDVTVIDFVEEDLLNTLQVYPNPTNGIVQVDFKEQLINAEIQVFDAIGQRVSHFDLLSKTQYSFELPEESGIYLIQISLLKGERYLNKSFRLVKE